MTPQELKNSILQLAIQGKLVEQRPEDWKYIRFGNAITLLSGTDFRPDEYNDKGQGVPYITGASSLTEDGVLVNRWTQTPRNIATFGDVLLVCKGSGYGKTVICDVRQAHIARQIMAVKKSDDLDMKYVRFFLMASLSQIKEKGQGIIPGIDRKSILNLDFPSPPLAEQKRIVAKIEELLPYIDRYEQAWTRLENFNKRFPMDMQKSLLQLAIQGKLVEQRTEEGTAEELYQQIQKEKQRLIREKKLKKEKPLPEITEDEVPFEIPESWKWVKLGNVAFVLGGKRIPAGRKLSAENTGHKYIRVSDMKDGSVLTDGLLYVPEDIYPAISKYIIHKEDIYITVAGTIGRVGKIPAEIDGANLTENADRLVFSIIDQDWLINCLNTPLVQSQIAGVTTKVGQPKLAIKRIQELAFPLPPLAEQKRIVAKLGELLPLCERLK